MEWDERPARVGVRRKGWRVPRPLKVFARGTSLRRRVAYSLAIVRIILVPVILLAVYYLFAMSWIVDRIVGVDAQVATLAENISIGMLNARRSDLDYFLLYDPEDLRSGRQALAGLDQTLAQCRALQAGKNSTLDQIQSQLQIYRQRLDVALQRFRERGQTPTEHLQQVVRDYERQLNMLLRRSDRESRSGLLVELRNQVGSFDTQMATTLAAGNPGLREVTGDLQSSSDRILELSSKLERESWDRVRRDHQQARELVRRAEWVLGIVSFLTILLSILVSLVLPRQVVRPLAELKKAVDHAAAGNYEIEFDVQGEGEVVQLANSVRELVAHLRERDLAELTRAGKSR